MAARFISRSIIECAKSMRWHSGAFVQNQVNILIRLMISSEDWWWNNSFQIQHDGTDVRCQLDIGSARDDRSEIPWPSSASRLRGLRVSWTCMSVDSILKHQLIPQVIGVWCRARRLCSDLRTLPVSRDPPWARHPHWSRLHLSWKRMRLQAKIREGRDRKLRQRRPPVIKLYS